MEIFGRMRLMGVALLLVTFVAGALSGAAIDRVLSADEPDRVVRDRDPDRGGDRDGDDGREGDDDHRRRYLIDRVEMPADQRAEIDAILEERTERMRAIWREVEPRLDAITDSARMEIMAALTPEQRAEYERLLNKRRGDDDDRR